jgi:membrane protein DedA with SNARE-associated domain
MRLLSKDFLKFAAAPLTLVVVFATVLVLFYIFPLPGKADIIAFMKHYYDQYGYWLVFIGAIGEGMLLFNWYFPGSVMVVFGVIFSRPDPVKAAVMVLLIMLGFFLSYLFNYALGKYGWYRLLLRLGLRKPLENAKTRVETKGLRLIFFTYFHPNLGALTATSAGILHLPFRKFLLYSIVAIIAWNTLWGFVAYFVGPVLLDYMGPTMVLIGLALWLVYLALKYSRRKGVVEVEVDK